MRLQLTAATMKLKPSSAHDYIASDFCTNVLAEEACPFSSINAIHLLLTKYTHTRTPWYIKTVQKKNTKNIRGRRWDGNKRHIAYKGRNIRHKQTVWKPCKIEWHQSTAKRGKQSQSRILYRAQIPLINKDEQKTFLWQAKIHTLISAIGNAKGIFFRQNIYDMKQKFRCIKRNEDLYLEIVKMKINVNFFHIALTDNWLPKAKIVALHCGL